MSNEIDINEREHHHWLLEISFSCSKSYYQFINWLRTEFYFFQQDNGIFLTIHFPNGRLKIERQVHCENKFVSKITVESKCKNIGLTIRKNLSEFLHHVKKYNTIKQR
ncbi:hypothetical protein A9996_07045 [Gelidibacter algens]|nr:hypothetical protein A9996_07045 [Gelidibacter algens]